MVNCFRRKPRRWFEVHALAFGLMVAGTSPVAAQSTLADQDVDLVVNGRVERVYRDGDDFLVQILVRAAEAQQLDPAGAIRYPALGQCVYVHVNGDDSVVGRVARGGRGPAVPNRNSPIRARLAASDSGRWVASGQDWFDERPGTGRGDRLSVDRSRSLAVPLGIEAERVFVGGESGLKVSRVSSGSAAAQAGIEPGDVLMKAAGTSLEGQAQLEKAYRESRGALEVTVRDIRSGRDVRIDIPSGGTPARNRNARSLGVVTETAFYGGEAALKVTQVDPKSPAQQSGIAPGLLILKVDGRAVGKPDELKDAVQRSRGQIELEIVDPQDRRERTVRVRL